MRRRRQVEVGRQVLAERARRRAGGRVRERVVNDRVAGHHDRRGSAHDREAPRDVADGVVAEAAADRRRGRDRVRAAGHRGGRGRARAGQRDRVHGVGIEQPDDRELGAREDDRLAVRLGPVVGGDGQRCRGDREAPRDVADGVVAEAAADRRRGRDRVRAAGHRGGRGRARAGQRDRVHGVGIEQPDDRELGAREDDRLAVRLGPVVGGDGQRCRGDREAPRDVADGVVAEAAADRRRGRDRVRAAGHRGGRGRARAGQRDRVHGVGIEQPDDRELGAREDDRLAVRLGPVVGGDGQRCRGDVERGTRRAGQSGTGRTQRVGPDRIHGQAVERGHAVDGGNGDRAAEGRPGRSERERDGRSALRDDLVARVQDGDGDGRRDRRAVDGVRRLLDECDVRRPVPGHRVVGRRRCRVVVAGDVGRAGCGDRGHDGARRGHPGDRHAERDRAACDGRPSWSRRRCRRRSRHR